MQRVFFEELNFNLISFQLALLKYKGKKWYTNVYMQLYLLDTEQ